MMTPLAHYQQDLQLGGMELDPVQADIIQRLNDLYDELIIADKRYHQKFWRLLNKLNVYQPQAVKGFYLWGGVGIGKTYLMDTFFHALPFQRKLRSHFHHFMRDVHHQLKQKQGQKNPLQKVAVEIAQQYQVICFDEFFVSDITNAMLLGNLFKALFEEGVTLVATSNTPPDELYRHGLQRNLFLPAIELIKQNTSVIHLPSQRDYRLRTLQQAGIFFSPLTWDAEAALRDSFESIARGMEEIGKQIVIEGRHIETVRLSHNVIWFEFMAICTIPRSQLDYLEIAKAYKTVLVANVPQIQANQDSYIRNFINLVDVLYDANVTLILSAATNIDLIYPTGPLSFDFERTKSRLVEMQSMEYLARPHIPG